MGVHDKRMCTPIAFQVRSSVFEKILQVGLQAFCHLELVAISFIQRIDDVASRRWLTLVECAELSLHDGVTDISRLKVNVPSERYVQLIAVVAVTRDVSLPL